jgi:nucleotide-binding universal stress UspA family protein
MTLRKVLCPIAFEENSMVALNVAKKIAANQGATLVLTHVAPVVMVPMEWTLEPYKAAAEDAQERLQKIAEQLGADVKCEIIVRVGDPPQGIIGVAVSTKADLIVMATHGRTGISHFVLGSVAERVVREAPCPVLTIRPETFAAKKAASGESGDG